MTPPQHIRVVLRRAPRRPTRDEREALEERTHAILADAERDEAATLTHHRVAYEYRLGRALLRTAVADALRARGLIRDPCDLRITPVRGGRTHLHEAHPDGRPVRLSINLSHTHGLLAVAVAAGELTVGIDVEDTARRTDLDALARRNFARAERRDLEATADIERRRRFFELWTLKEAYVKARGIGIGLGLGTFAWTIATTGVGPGPLCATAELARAPDHRREEPPLAWHGAVLDAGTEHVCSVVVGCSPQAPFAWRPALRVDWDEPAVTGS